MEILTKNVAIICYLCGKPILEDKSKDHWPPFQFFPSSLRKKHNPSRLVTIPAHKKCNAAYSSDEEYFFVSLGCLVEDKYIQTAILKDIQEKFKNPKRQALYHKVRNEFTNQTNAGLYFPGDKLGKKIDLARIENIIWKIIRGMYFLEKDGVLPENSNKYIRMMDPQQHHPKKINEIFERVKSQKEKGEYGRLFSYKILESKPGGLYSAGLLFWNQIMFLSIFHGPECTCSDCASKTAEKGAHIPLSTTVEQ